jgi:hypothetical protein
MPNAVAPLTNCYGTYEQFLFACPAQQGSLQELSIQLKFNTDVSTRTQVLMAKHGDGKLHSMLPLISTS